MSFIEDWKENQYKINMTFNLAPIRWVKFTKFSLQRYIDKEK